MALYIAAALAAFILIGAGIVVTIASYELRGYIETRHSALGQEAAEVLASGGRPALEEWLRTSANVPSDVQVYILDEQSRDVLGRSVPSQYAEFVKRSVVGLVEQTTTNYRPVRLAPQLVGPANELYSFLLLPRGISLWGSPATGLGLGAAGLLVIVIVAWLIARTFGRPIGDLQMTVRQLASGDIDARVPAKISGRHDELGALAADFNAMAEQLSRLIHNRGQLMREMSHELRSPLARLEAALALAGSKQKLADDERDRIAREIRIMDKAIGEMLRYSRLDSTVGLSRRLLRLDRQLKKLVEVEELEAVARHCRLELRTDNELAVVGDPELLRSGLENVVRNAIRYAPDDSVVEIEARRAGRVIKIDISDRGPGVPPEHLERIFEPYFRVQSGASDNTGSGLGLAIAQRVLEVHGGRVTANARPGGGLTVSCELPAAELI